MTYQGNAKNILGALVVVVCFIIGCMFLYWAVQYWVYNTLDRGRYEISKIQPAGGVDSLSFWKLDRRTGGVEYCNMTPPTATKASEFTCVAAISSAPSPKLESNIPLATPAAPAPDAVAATAATPAQ
jgi:hypothetical protein